MRACRSFEEFKGLYNAAIDDSLGKLSKGSTKTTASRTSSGLDGGTLDARKKIAMEKARKKAEEAERIRQENAAMKERIKGQLKGKDAKGLDAGVEAQRKEMALARKQAKAAEAVSRCRPRKNGARQSRMSSAHT